MKRVVDISHHNTITNWDNLKKCCDGVVVRIGHGCNGLDMKVNEHISFLSEYSIPFGLYLYSDSTKDKSYVDEEIGRLIEKFNEVERAKFIAFDQEKCLDNKSLLDAAHMLATSDIPAMWYTGMNHMLGYSTEVKLFIRENLGMWIARYNDIAPEIFCDMWQFTNNYSLRDNGSVDCSYITDAAYKYWFGGEKNNVQYIDTDSIVFNLESGQKIDITMEVSKK